MTDTNRSYQCGPLPGVETLRFSLMGKNMWVISEKLGSASLSMRESSISISIMVIEGRRRAIFKLYMEGSSRSMYLG
jgi:hypothetical protein